MAAGILGWVIMFAPLGLVMWMSFGINRMSTGTAQALFWASRLLMGLSMSTIFLVYTGVSIAQTFFAVAAAFAGLSLWGYTTKKDLRAGHVPDHGRGRPDRGDGDQPVPALDGDGPGDQRDRRADLRRA
jgi:hypothetical protein